jgi:hypothetical protein
MIVSKRLLVLTIITEELAKSGVCINETTILRVLQVVLGNVLAQILCNIYARMLLLGIKLGKLGNVGRNIHGLKKTRVVVLTSRGSLVLQNTSGRSVQCTKTLVHIVTQKSGKRRRGLVSKLTQTRNLGLKNAKKLGKLCHHTLASRGDTRCPRLLLLCGSVG